MNLTDLLNVKLTEVIDRQTFLEKKIPGVYNSWLSNWVKRIVRHRFVVFVIYLTNLKHNWSITHELIKTFHSTNMQECLSPHVSVTYEWIPFLCVCNIFISTSACFLSVSRLNCTPVPWPKEITRKSYYFCSMYRDNELAKIIVQSNGWWFFLDVYKGTAIVFRGRNT